MIQLTPEQIEENRIFCAKRVIVEKTMPKKVKSKKGTKAKFKEIAPNPEKLKEIIDYITKNSPVTSIKISKAFNSKYIYQPHLRKYLIATKKVSYSKSKKVWYTKGKPISEFPRDTKKDRLLSEIKKLGVITNEQARLVAKGSTRSYLSDFKKKGLIENIAACTWRWVGK